MYFSFFSAQEFMRFTSQIIVERTSVCSRASVKEQGRLTHLIVSSAKNTNLFHLCVYNSCIILLSSLHVAL